MVLCRMQTHTSQHSQHASSKSVYIGGSIKELAGYSTTAPSPVPSAPATSVNLPKYICAGMDVPRAKRAQHGGVAVFAR